VTRFFFFAFCLAGGINEMFYTNGTAAHEQIVLSKRKGFIKLALETGCDIIPQYSFGANQAYIRPFGPDSFLCKLSAFLRISTVVWYGRWWIPMGILPFKVPILTVTGPVFHVPQVDSDNITNELVVKVHDEFCRALKRLFDEYKIVYVQEMGAPEEWLTRELLFENEKKPLD
jgi:diacylglycerol O-acyltransferase 2, plant